jgi:Fe-S-cluster-containing dehydrogenase component/Ni/Fe-hydrogenase subunit HybB-like protein
MLPPDRREFIKYLGCLSAAGAGVLTGAEASAAGGGHGLAAPPEAMGVLVDLTVCIGCRLCEHACKKANGYDPGPLESYDDQSVFKDQRRPAPEAYTVVNSYSNPADAGRPVYVKTNCMHCNHPACVSACIVGALRKRENGAVTYDAWKCIGCRYCMVACPFQIPAYSYDDAFTPEVRKCQFCFSKITQGETPGCIAACPRETMVFGKRSELLKLAEEKIAAHPGTYVHHIYGEKEVGGTSWMYLSAAPFEKIGFLQLSSAAPSVLTETIQHSVFKYGLPPLALYGVLGGLMYLNKPRKQVQAAVAEEVAEPAATVHVRRPALALVGGGEGGPDSFEEMLHGDNDDHPADHKPRPAQAEPHDSHHAEHDEEPRPVNTTLRTPGVFLMLALIGIGLAFGLYRFIFGIGAGTNLDQQYPWGLWIGIDVASGVALAAGGFTSAFLTHILHRERYHAIIRPALLTAMLGYTFVVIGLQADLGRYYNVWHPVFMWQGNSVLFEVGMCVMCYLNVLYLEFAPIVCERLMKEARFPRIARLAAFFQPRIEKIMFLLVIAGCVLSCLHQSSLGNLMVIAPSKLHALWWTPWSPLLFLLSAIAVGFPMIIWESLFAAWSLRLKPEMSVLGPLARFIPFTLGVYLSMKVWDVIHRGAYVYLDDGSVQSICWLIEMAGGVLIPLILLCFKRVRQSPLALFIAATMIVSGVIFNRVNVFLIGYRPPYTDKAYVPWFGEFAVTIGLIACLMLVYRLIVTFFPVISQPKVKAAA